MNRTITSYRIVDGNPHLFDSDGKRLYMSKNVIGADYCGMRISKLGKLCTPVEMLAAMQIVEKLGKDVETPPSVVVQSVIQDLSPELPHSGARASYQIGNGSIRLGLFGEIRLHIDLHQPVMTIEDLIKVKEHLDAQPIPKRIQPSTLTRRTFFKRFFNR